LLARIEKAALARRLHEVLQNVCQKFWNVTRRSSFASTTTGRSTLRMKVDFARIGPPVVVVKTNGEGVRPCATASRTIHCRCRPKPVATSRERSTTPT
jgi:hypothetical protein